MLVMRILGVVAAILVGAGVLAWMFSGDRGYLRFAWKVTRFTLVVVAILLVLLALERLLPV